MLSTSLFKYLLKLGLKDKMWRCNVVYYLHARSGGAARGTRRARGVPAEIRSPGRTTQNTSTLYCTVLRAPVISPVPRVSVNRNKTSWHGTTVPSTQSELNGYLQDTRSSELYTYVSTLNKYSYITDASYNTGACAVARDSETQCSTLYAYNKQLYHYNIPYYSV